MNIVYARQPFPREVISSIFLAGPTPRDSKTRSWRPEAIAFLAAANYQGHVFVPELESGGMGGDEPAGYRAQVEWEEEALHRADVIVFWIPRNLKTLPGLTTNDEWGRWRDSGKVVLGFPEDAANVRYQKYYADKLLIPACTSLAETISVALATVGQGAHRQGAEVQVPLNIWRHPTFQAWLASQRDVGNRLDGARVLWSFRIGKKRDVVFSWVVHVDVHVEAEGRNKRNEFVLGRTDVASVVLWRRERDAGVLDTEIVMVKEFRSPVRNHDGFVYELPGGSAHDPTMSDKNVAVEEVEQETGIKIAADRLRRHGVRQVAATLSAHVSTVFSVELTAEEMNAARDEAAAGTVHGVAKDTERTYVDVMTLSYAIESGLVDWTTLGQIMTVLALPKGGE